MNHYGFDPDDLPDEAFDKPPRCTCGNYGDPENEYCRAHALEEGESDE